MTFKTLLTSGDKIPENLVPVLDFVLINASALLMVAGIAHDYIEGTKLGRESIISGNAWKTLETFREEGRRGIIIYNYPLLLILFSLTFDKALDPRGLKKLHTLLRQRPAIVPLAQCRSYFRETQITKQLEIS